MPEVLTKHPDIVLDVLKSGGAKCGEGLPQEILTQCRPEAFCKLPGGEMCVYGLAEVDSMTQIEDDDLAPLVCPQNSGGCAAAGPADAAALVGAALLGLLIGRRSQHCGRQTSGS
jgi:hypothetical protein